MSKILYPKIFIGLWLIGGLVACNLPASQVAGTKTETPALTANPTQTTPPLPTASPTETASPVPTAAAPVVLISPTPKFAPFCQPSSASVATPIQCQMPIAEQSSSFCQDKSPYNLILMNPGSTYENSNDDIECSDAGVKDGKLIVICTGPMAIPFELEVCDPSCPIPPFQAGTTNCPQDLHYNERLRCCEREQIPGDENCVTLSLRTKSCAIACNMYTDQATCEKNAASACVWHDGQKKCYQRK